MPQYLSPGVYVEEVPSAIKAIAGVSTSTPGFTGLVPDTIHLVAKDPHTAPTPEVPTPTKFVDFAPLAAAKVPVLITNWSQFTRQFGDLVGDETAAASGAGAAVDEGHRNLAHAVY